ncbi:MAG: hypothetical protein CM15mP29_0300 [Alphaproteobacteria bacterium]|nr:MAG: hypothetical protein CM15mP29_0300 [Alphaproteobacteria bacterium]
MNKFLERMYNNEYDFVAMERALISNQIGQNLLGIKNMKKLKFLHQRI